ncbi:aspartate carbamoyltransferase regulatory subunit [Methanohalophilus sp.]|uniref:aspartate carbamoyltransferase regulatory subunit n=1 Tax=Methanohalophilus sp. TaxID=1966352 RepID=UPI00262FB64D|nr:aspartate carbamoyltransferase regulatory subunit [Methanohalophilus sp.]MDK2892158.1 aspartate carbamoyltransferase regulatory subunit [Methanohalophilus sp.]
MSASKKEIRVQPIENGTVIDHITAGQALNVLKILGISGVSSGVVSVLINAPGEAGNKDVVKIEGRELEADEADRISLIAPNATINIIRDFEVQEKKNVEIPRHVEGIVKCINSNCISNSNEPVASKFEVRNLKSGIELRCDYCERVISENIAEHLL